MAEEAKQDGQKTLVAFVVGLLIGGMLVWAFSGPSTETIETTPQTDETSEEQSDEVENDTSESDESEEGSTEDTSSTPAPTMQVGDGSVEVSDQPAGMTVELESVTYPISEGWIGVRDFNNDQLGYIKGVVRFSESQGLVPENIILQYPTTPGNRYAVVIFTEDGDRDFSLANDVQIDEIFGTFVAQ